MIDNSELDEILAKLESLEDEEKAVVLLQDFNKYSSELGKLLLNLDKSLSNEEWKRQCEDAKNRLEKVIKEIKQL
jgi:DNA-directed RNA polymerase specialized sigma24 family protein